MLHDYLHRIGIDSRVPADAVGLRTLQRAHLFTVPFENLDIHRGVPIHLDLDRLLEKIVKRRRGGFCYELNAAFAWLLLEHGFEVRMLSANVHRPDGTWGIDFDHMLLRVDLDESWIADVGFGDNFLDPLRLVEGVIQTQAVGDYHFTRESPHWILRRAGEPQYRFTEVRFALEDFAPGCTFHQSPESHFTKGAICSLALPDGRVTLRPDRLIVTRGGTRTESPVADWEWALREHFGIDLCESPGAEN